MSGQSKSSLRELLEQIAEVVLVLALVVRLVVRLVVILLSVIVLLIFPLLLIVIYCRWPAYYNWIRGFSAPDSGPLMSTLIVALSALATYKFNKSLSKFRPTFKCWREAVKNKFRNNQFKDELHKCSGSLFGNTLRLGWIFSIPFAILLGVFSYHLLDVRHSPPPEPIIGYPPEPIIGYPVLFGKAQGMPSQDSSGIKLEHGHRVQLEKFMELLKSLSNSRPDPIEFLIIGYASHTPFYSAENKDYDQNLLVANLRAKAVGSFLGKELKDLGHGCSRLEWKQHGKLEMHRPYKNPANLPDDLAFERLNQSVMLYVMTKDETGHVFTLEAKSGDPSDHLTSSGGRGNGFAIVPCEM